MKWRGGRAAKARRARQNAGMALTLHTADVVVPSAAEGVEPIEGGAVLVEGDRIVAIGEANELRGSSDAKGAKIREHRGALTPGLVNAHSHLQYTAFADLASLGVPFPTWLGHMVKRRSAMTPARMGGVRARRHAPGDRVGDDRGRRHRH